MITNLYEKTLYTIPMDFIITPIYEYDITKANISVLLQKGVINIDQYNEYYKMPRQERQVKIGWIQRNNPEVIKILEQGFCEARRNFIISNNIQDDEIVSIKKDSLFVTKPVTNVTFGCINFTHRNTYCLMAKLKKLECYYFYDPKTGFYNIDIKGIKDEMLSKHESFFLSAICDVFYTVMDNRIEDAVNYIVSLANNYDAMNLKPEFYREFNQSSLYRINSLNSVFYIDDITSVPVGCIDTEYNRQIIRELVKLITKIYISLRHHP